MNCYRSSNDATEPEVWNLANALREISDEVFEISGLGKAIMTTWFSDIGAVVCYLRAVPWQIPDFMI